MALEGTAEWSGATVDTFTRSTCVATCMNEFRELTDSPIALISREQPEGAEDFFQKVLALGDDLPLESFCKVNRASAFDDIKRLVDEHYPEPLRTHVFYTKWISDMAQLSEQFAVFLQSDAVCFWIGAERGCKRFHVDSAPFRLLVTYAGAGTEILPDPAGDRQAYHDLRDSEDILKDESALFSMPLWHVAVFRGEPEWKKHLTRGVLHRSPGLPDGQSILLRLDLPEYVELLEMSDDEDEGDDEGEGDEGDDKDTVDEGEDEMKRE